MPSSCLRLASSSKGIPVCVCVPCLAPASSPSPPPPLPLLHHLSHPSPIPLANCTSSQPQSPAQSPPSPVAPVQPACLCDADSAHPPDMIPGAKPDSLPSRRKFRILEFSGPQICRSLLSSVVEHWLPNVTRRGGRRRRWRALRTAATAQPPSLPRCHRRQCHCCRACAAHLALLHSTQPARSTPACYTLPRPWPRLLAAERISQRFQRCRTLPRIPSSRRTRLPANHDRPGSPYARPSLAPSSDSPKPPSCLRRIASSSPRLMLPFTRTPITFLSQPNMLLFHPLHRCPGDAATPSLARLSSTTLCSPCSHRTGAHADTSCCSPSPPPRLC
jgi:hypothetical protein